MKHSIQSIGDLDKIHLNGIALVPGYVKPALEYLNCLLFSYRDADLIVAKLIDDVNETISLCELISPNKPLSPDIYTLRSYHEDLKAKLFVLRQHLSRVSTSSHNPPRQLPLFRTRQRTSNVRLF